jgi:hypothetical protein
MPPSDRERLAGQHPRDLSAELRRKLVLERLPVSGTRPCSGSGRSTRPITLRPNPCGRRFREPHAQGGGVARAGVASYAPDHERGVGTAAAGGHGRDPDPGRVGTGHGGRHRSDAPICARTGSLRKDDERITTRVAGSGGAAADSRGAVARPHPSPPAFLGEAGSFGTGFGRGSVVGRGVWSFGARGAAGVRQ